ncbi:MAG: transposase [Candidatus Entotheonellia bacterium]
MSVSENKTVDGIHRSFVIDGRKQRRLHRWVHESPLTVDALNRARLKRLSSLAGTPRKPKGVFSIDETFLTHDGHPCEKIASRYDHTRGCDVWAHTLVHLHDSDDQTDSPVAFR